MIPVRVKYTSRRMCGARGYDITVLRAQGDLVMLCDRWTAGSLEEARREFADMCRKNGWVESRERADRMRGAA